MPSARISRAGRDVNILEQLALIKLILTIRQIDLLR